MFFILSKTLNFLVLPLTLVVIPLVLSVIIKKQPWKKRFFWTGFVLLLFFSNDFIANKIMMMWEVEPKPFVELHPYEVGIVLTGATKSFMQPEDRVYFQRGADRVTHTIQLYKLGLIKKIIISGGTGRVLKKDEPEANKFQRVMVMAGIPETDIVIENQTRNTGESAIAVRKIIDSLQVKPENCLLITSAFHMRRSLACYRKAEMNVESFSTDFYAEREQLWITALVLPSVQGFIKWEKLLKEWTGLLAYKLASYV